jgi:uncharacterized cupredoxin-like copper-binding protein
MLIITILTTIERIESDECRGERTLRAHIVALVLGAFAHAAAAQGHAGHAAHDKAFGRKGDPKKVSRTIELDMSDAMRFSPAELVVKQGETVRFRLKNSGKVMHEMVLGTMQELKEHAEAMRQHPGMHHAEANMVHVSPGKTGTLVWQFANAGEFHYACLVPGHFEAGMVGKLTVAR